MLNKLENTVEFAWVDQYKWHRGPRGSRCEGYYAYAMFDAKDRKTPRSMHNFLMSPPRGLDVDHKDNDGLNNRRSTNLRIVTRRNNNYNSRTRSDNKSGHKGVSWAKRERLWRATIQGIDLGWFKEKQDAINARLKAEKIYIDLPEYKEDYGK